MLDGPRIMGDVVAVEKTRGKLQYRLTLADGRILTTRSNSSDNFKLSSGRAFGPAVLVLTSAGTVRGIYPAYVVHESIRHGQFTYDADTYGETLADAARGALEASPYVAHDASMTGEHGDAFRASAVRVLERVGKLEHGWSDFTVTHRGEA